MGRPSTSPRRGAQRRLVAARRRRDGRGLPGGRARAGPRRRPPGGAGAAVGAGAGPGTARERARRGAALARLRQRAGRRRAEALVVGAGAAGPLCAAARLHRGAAVVAAVGGDQRAAYRGGARGRQRGHAARRAALVDRQPRRGAIQQGAAAMTQRGYRFVLIAIAAALSAALAWQWGAGQADHDTAPSAAGRAGASDADGLRLRRTLQQASTEAQGKDPRDPFSYARAPERDTAPPTRPVQPVVAKPKPPAVQEPAPIEAPPAAPADPPLRLLAVAVRGSKPVASLPY